MIVKANAERMLFNFVYFVVLMFLWGGVTVVFGFGVNPITIILGLILYYATKDRVYQKL